MGTTSQQYRSCQGGDGSDHTCAIYLQDTGACCMSLTLKNMPESDTALSDKELKVLNAALNSGAPTQEDMTKYLCIGTEKL